MINFKTQSLIDLFQTVSSRDLNKSLTFDTLGGRFGIDRHTVAESKSLNERTFITARQTLTDAGDCNLCVRMQVANALRSLAGGGAATEAQRAFFEGALRELLGIEGGEGEISLQVACKPLAMRVVKQLLTKAENLFALSGLQGGMARSAAEAADLTTRLNETAALNGKEKVATKLVGNLERDLAALGVRLAAARTDDERMTVNRDIDRTLRTFNTDARAALAKMTSLESVARDALARYAAKGGERLGDLAQMRFVGFFARTQLVPGMNVKKLRTKLLETLPGFVDGLRTQPPVTGERFADAHVEMAAFTRAVQVMQAKQTEAGQLVTEGRKLTAPPDFALGRDAFNTDVFLRGGVAVGDGYHAVVTDFRADMTTRTDAQSVSVRLDARHDVRVDLSNASERPSKAGIVSGTVMELCAGNRLQAAGVLAALGQRVDVIANVLARELLIPNAAEGNIYAVSRDADGSVLVKISTVPGSSMESSVTLRIGADGNRTVADFSGVKTNDAFAEGQELAARRARLTEMLPACRQAVSDANQRIATGVETLVTREVFDDDEAMLLNRSAGVALQGLVVTLETLAETGGPVNKDFGEYQRSFEQGVQAIVQRSLNRVAANGELADGVTRIGAQLQKVLKDAAASCRANNAAMAEQLDAFAAKVDAHLKRLQSDFYLSNEDLQESAAAIVQTLETFAARIDEQARALPANPKTPEDVAKYAALLSAELPRAAYTSVSQEAREKLIASHALVSCADITRLGKDNPAFKPVADSVSVFAASVNDLLAQAEAWPRGERQTFGELVRVKTEQLMRAVVEAQEEKVAFDANGIEALLRGTFDVLAGTFREREAALRGAELDETVQAARARLDDLLSRGADLSALQREALEGALTRLDAYADLVRLGTLPTREGVKTLAFQLRQEVERFVGQVFDPSVGGKAKRFFSGFKGVFAKQDPARLFPFNPPAATLAEDVQTARNPFGENGVGSLDALNRLTRATRAVTAALDANPELLDRAISTFEGLEGAARFLAMDDDGNVHGFKVENGRNEGLELVQAAFREVVRERVAQLADSDAIRHGGLVDVGALATPEWKASLLEAVRQRLVTALEVDRNVEAREAQPAEGPIRPGEVHERGGHVFGLNVDTLTQVQVRNLKLIMLSTLLESQCNACLDQQRQIDQMQDGPVKEERQRQLDAILGQWIREPNPLKRTFRESEAGLTAGIVEGVAAMRLTDKLVKRLGEAILTGRLSLDEPLTLDTCRLVVGMMEFKSLGEGVQFEEGARRSLGFGTDDPAAIYNALRVNGLHMEDIDRLMANDGGNFSEATLVQLLDLLYQVNRNDVNGLDSLAVRMFGKRLEEMTEADYLAYRNSHNTNNNLLGLDPLLHLQGAERKAADFFLRTGQPTTAYVAETRAIYDAIRGMEQAQGPQELALTYAGRAVTLKTDGRGHLEMGMAQLQIGRETRDVRFLCPLDLAAFRRQIEDEMSRNVKAYGVETAFNLLPQGVESGVVRQLALNVIAGTTGTLATELSDLETTAVVDLARDLLTAMRTGTVDAKAFLADRLARRPTANVVCFNGEATLECYRRMETADPAERDAKVVLPEQRMRREGESVVDARRRQVHAFVSELVMPNDTTKYDLDRRRGLSESDVLRQTLLAHRYELEVVLRSLDGENDLLDGFSMVAGDAPPGGGEPPRMNEMTVALKTRMGQLKTLVDGPGGMDAFFRALQTGEDVNGVKAFLEGFAADIAKASDAMLGKMQQMLTDKLADAFRQSMAAKDKPLWQQTLDEIAGAGTLDVDSGYGQFLMESLATYFTKMAPIDRHRMASALFRFADSRSNSGELLGALIKGAGPVLQKLMQGLPQTALPPDLRAAVADLKSRLPPIAPEMVRATLLDMVNESNGYITKVELVQSFGAATVGQTFLCRVHTRDNPAGEECVLKLLRPDVQNRARRERALFLELAAKNPSMKDALRSRIESIFEELDFTVEANNVKQGAVYNTGVVRDGIAGVRSMELYPYLSASANVMVLRKAPGSTYDRYVETTTRRIDALLGTLNPVDNQDGTRSYRAGGLQTFFDAKTELLQTYDALLGRQRRLSGFVQKWTYEVFFGDGFFHGDLHAGNIMCDDENLTVIDYGNAQRLTKAEMKNLKWALAWVPARDPHNFLEYYRQILSPEGRRQLDAKRKTIEAALTNVFERGNVADTGKIVSAIFQVIQQNGVELPGAIFCILQSMQRLDESMRLMNEQLARVETAFHALKLGNDVGADDSPRFIKKIREVFSQTVYPRAQMGTLRRHFGEGLSLDQMRARVNDVTPMFVVQALDLITFFGGEPTTEQVIQRYADLPARIQDHMRHGSTYHDFASATQAAIIRPIGVNSIQVERTLEEEMKAQVARLAGQDHADAATARTELGRSLQEIQDFAVKMSQSKDPNITLGVSTVTLALDGINAALAGEGAPDVEALNMKVHELCDSLTLLVNPMVGGAFDLIFAGDSETAVAEGESFATYDDPSAPFGEALSRGSKAFLNELLPQDKGTLAKLSGGISVLMGGGLTLRAKLRGATEDSYRLAHRSAYFKNTRPWSTFLADHGLYRLEEKAIWNEIDNIRFSSEVFQDLQKTGWVRNRAACGRVKEALRFNLDCILGALRTKGFTADVDNAQKRAALIQYAMRCLAEARPEWYRSLQGVSAQTLATQLQLGNDADLRTAFACLRDIANARPPLDDALTEGDTTEIDEMFSIA